MGDGTSGDSQDPGFDLFDRWLAHREESATPDEEAAAEATDAEPPAEAVPEEPAAEEPVPAADGQIDPLFDESFPTDESEQTLEEPDLELPLDLLSPAPPAPPPAPPVASEVPSSAAPSPAGTDLVTGPPAQRSRADLSNDVSRSILEALATPTPGERPPDPNAVTPETFEPVIIPSARKKTEPRRGLLSGRRKKIGVDPLDQPLDQVLDLPLDEPLVEAERPAEAISLADPAEAAREAELDRLAAEQAERQAELLRQTQAADAARQADLDRLAAEEATRAAEAARQAELDRLAAEQAERQAELLRQTQAAEEARQAEADRLAAEEATRAAEAARQAELDRLAAEQAERQAELLRQTQAAEEARQAEADRLAAEQAEREAEAARQAELDRLAAEQAEREAELLRQTQAAEAARHAELDRLAAEQAERQAELLRQTQAAEAAQAEAEAEAERVADDEAARAPGPADTPAAPDAGGRADQVDAGREVFAAFAAAGAETDVPVTPPTEDEPDPRRHRRLGQRLTGGGATAPTPRPAARPAPRPAERPAGLSQPDAVRALLAERAASGETRAEPAASRPTPQTPRPGRDLAPVGESTNVDFAPRTGTRRLVNVLLLLALGAAAVAAYVAYEDRSEVNIGVAATLGVLALVIWAVRAGSDTARLSVRAGQLEVVRGGGRFVFDLTSRYTPIEVVGKPGQRGWKVLFLRRSMAPFVVDASMVDPEEFMRVLRRHRPDPD